MVRGGRRVRVGLAGPGKLFGYEALIDGRPSPSPRSRGSGRCCWCCPRPVRAALLREDGIARVFLDVIQRDILATLRQTLPALARPASA